MRLAAALALALLLGGCAAPDATFPGVRTHSTVEDGFRCGELLFAAGCVIVRVPAVESGCAPEAPGYVVCNATLSWSASSGAVAPGSTLLVSVNGTLAAECAVAPGAACTRAGNATFTHHFDGPGERHAWNVTVEARLVAPGAPAAATGEFRLTVAMVVRAEGTGATDV